MRPNVIWTHAERVSRVKVGIRSASVHSRKAHRCWFSWVVASSMVLASAPALARTDLQQMQAEGVFASWDNIVAAAAQAGGLANLPGLTQDLFGRLDELHETDIGGSAFGVDLDLSSGELDAAYQQTASEEAATFRSTLTDSSYAQMNNVLSRLVLLRSGATGVSVAGLAFNPDIPGLAQLQPAGDLRPARGGGASADETLGYSGYSNFGAFVNGSFGTGDVDTTKRENGYDYDTYGITAGVDYRFTRNLVLGSALGYSWLDSDYKNSATVAGGGVDTDGYSLAVYGTYYTERFYVDGIASFGKNDYDLTRRVLVPLGSASSASQSDWNRTAKADTDSKQYLLGVGTGYEVPWGATSITPYLRANYLKADIDGYTETGAGGLEFITADYDIESLVSVLGVSATHAISRKFGVLVPQVRFSWLHEFMNDSQTIDYRYAWEAVPTGGSPWIFPVKTENPDRDYFALGLGLSSVFRGGTQAFFDYQTLLGHNRVTEHLFTVGLRGEF